MHNIIYFPVISQDLRLPQIATFLPHLEIYLRYGFQQSMQYLILTNSYLLEPIFKY